MLVAGPGSWAQSWQLTPANIDSALAVAQARLALTSLGGTARLVSFQAWTLRSLEQPPLTAE